MAAERLTPSGHPPAILTVFYVGDARPPVLSVALEALLVAEALPPETAGGEGDPGGAAPAARPHLHLLTWGLDAVQLPAVDEWERTPKPGAEKASSETVPSDVTVDGLLERLLAPGPANAPGVAEGPEIVVVLAGAGRARGAAALARRASEEGIVVRLLPEGVDLHREAVTSDLWRLYELTEKLRHECPWDRKQTQESIVAYTLEETYELVDTIRERAREGGDAAVRGELGDLLFQVYFISCVAEEEGLYDIGEVAAGIHRKLVRRHPHIFADASAETPDDVKRTWDIIKKESEGREGIFHDVPSAFPATLLAQKLQQRAAAVGFDWDEAHEVLAKLKEETAEIEHELASGGDRERVAAEMGDLLFSVINLARKLKVDPELALRGTALRFRERVEQAAKIAESRGLVFEDLALEDQETYYQHAKEGLKP